MQDGGCPAAPLLVVCHTSPGSASCHHSPCNLTEPRFPCKSKQAFLWACDMIQTPSPKGISGTSKEGGVKTRQLLQNEKYSQTCKVDLLLIHNLKRVISPSCPYRDAYYTGWVLRLGFRSRTWSLLCLLKENIRGLLYLFINRFWLILYSLMSIMRLYG